MLEKILSRLGKLFILGAVLGAGEVNSSKAYAQNVPEKKVLFYMQSKDFNGNIKREFEPGENFNLEIYADNRALEGEKTGAVLWRTISQLNLTGITPIGHYGQNDFFFPFITGKNFAFRIIIEIPTTAKNRSKNHFFFNFFSSHLQIPLTNRDS